MPASLTLSAATLYAFLLVLARVGSALVFVPLPGVRGAAEPARAALAIGFTMALSSRWPQVDGGGLTAGILAGWVAAEAATGLAIGISVAIVVEAFALAAQIAGLQAGYAYASTIDPNTEADSGVLLVFAQLLGGMLFFAMGLDRDTFRLFAQTFDRIPTGVYALSTASTAAIIRLGSSLFAFGVRLALPVVALLLMVDIALALLGRLNQQLQLLALAFPLKMLTALLVLSWIASMFPRLLLAFSAEGWAAARRAIGL
jgi:flagellar biosynthetic protein FliR